MRDWERKACTTLTATSGYVGEGSLAPWPLTLGPWGQSAPDLQGQHGRRTWPSPYPKDTREKSATYRSTPQVFHSTKHKQTNSCNYHGTVDYKTCIYIKPMEYCTKYPQMCTIPVKLSWWNHSWKTLEFLPYPLLVWISTNKMDNALQYRQVLNTNTKTRSANWHYHLLDKHKQNGKCLTV